MLVEQAIARAIRRREGLVALFIKGITRLVSAFLFGLPQRFLELLERCLLLFRQRGLIRVLVLDQGLLKLVEAVALRLLTGILLLWGFFLLLSHLHILLLGHIVPGCLDHFFPIVVFWFVRLQANKIIINTLSFSIDRVNIV